MPFVMRRGDADRPESPEALFRSLRPVDRTIRDLLLRQGDALRAYAQLAADETDVAVELPTGGGKTLVGLLIAEWRRRALNHRVAYLCPNVQLVRQVAAKAESYGLDVVTLVRAQAEWAPLDFNRFQRGQAVAIAGYYQVFNSNPRLNSAQTLILDDAHAAEQAVASNWSIEATPPSLLFRALAAILAPYLPEGLARLLDRENDDPFDPGEVAMVPPEAMAQVAGDLERALAEYATDRRDPNAYSKAMLGTAIGRCVGFVAANRVLIRPLIPPTSEHPPFADAQQRIYMSATLGAAGELQRAFGVPRITRISGTAEDNRGFGRRFFVMPHAARVAADEITAQAIAEAGRAVILAPSNYEAQEACSGLVPGATTVVNGDEVEESFEPFVNQQTAVLLLTNRYDGIDLPDDACRLLVLSGLPAFAHLQERFIMDSLGARRVLSERIRTRVQQGSGRATRNARDFAAVIIRGAALTDFLARDEELKALAPQLQAEIEFGFNNSESPDVDLLELLRSFWTQDADWQNAEHALVADTADRQRHVSASDQALANSAEKEVMCWRAVFVDDLPRAVALAQEVTDLLIGGDELRPYRALWFYLASCWAFQLARTDPGRWQAQARVLQHEARGCASALRWTPRWVAEPLETDPHQAPAGRGELGAKVMRSLGIRGGRFEEHLHRTADLLASDTASEFEEGLKLLGCLLGFEAVRPNGQADPDGAWRDSTTAWLIFEAKTEERADTPLSAETIRQAATHQDWIKNVQGWEPADDAITIIVSPKTNVDDAAVPIAGELRLCAPEIVRGVGERTFDALRQARAAARGLSDEQLAASVAAAFSEHDLAVDDLISELGARRIANG
jgi:hypothetical protein